MKTLLLRKGFMPTNKTPFCRAATCAGHMLFGVVTAFLGNVGFAQGWRTVDDFQYSSGQNAQNYGLAVALNGTLFASGMAGDSTGHYHALVMASTDAGNT